MSDIQRYGYDKVWGMEKNELGDYVQYDDHAAIVAQLEADLAEARKPISGEQIESIIYQCDGFLKWGVGDHGKQMIREKIRAIIKDQQ